MIIPVILAGGSGTRLWPMSRELFPKQLLRLTGSRTMFQQTLVRLGGVKNAADPMVICNKEHRYPVTEQLLELDGYQESAMILEPGGRNTAPAVAVAAIKALSVNSDARILILPADHLIGDTDAFCRAVHTADRYADMGYLITFGVIPDTPETGYGYIRKGRALDNHNHTDKESLTEVCAIDRFVEKPDFNTAEKYLASGQYCWNSGMFLFRAADVYAELEKYAPRIVASCQEAWQKATFQDGAFCLDQASFSRCPSDSIDYAVMEKTKKGAMVPFQAAWNDLGSWDAMWEAGDKDADRNVIKGEVIARGLKNSLVFSDSRLVAVLGIENTVVVETSDALLVADRSRAQDVKSVAAVLKGENRTEAFCRETAYSEWGTETRISKDPEYMIRRISIRPSKTMEFTAPCERRFHWTVISGTGRIRREDSVMNAQKGLFLEIAPQSGIGAESTGEDPLVIIEVGFPV
ncbi:MAG: mannose-1-phosphate guanylyltransferase/mannose-6-phosphate isomerase [Desulfobacteraceae bacterium]|nr:mannose-1-phosphate guanylyltransferase/mannose-6-phosphate isomerase [Desulfobacteraceae bacterium]